MAVNLKGRSFLTLMDFSPAEIDYLLTLAADLKAKKRAGIRGNTLIVNLPGSPKAVRENLSAILDTLEHAVHMMQGRGH